MAQVKQITGLMATPQRGYTGRVQGATPTIDTTASKFVDEALQSTTKLVGLMSRQQKKAYDDMVDARVTELATEYGVGWAENLAGKNGALHVKGKAVVEGVDGEDFTSHYMGRMRDTRERFLSSVAQDPNIHKRLEEKLNKLDAEGQSKLIAHEGLENRAYVISSNESGVALHVGRIAKGSASIEDVQSARAYQRKVNELNGLDRDDPASMAKLDASISTALLDSASVKMSNGDLEGAKAIHLFGVKEGLFSAEDMLKSEDSIRTAENERSVAFAASNAAYSIVDEQSSSGSALRAAGYYGVPVSDDVLRTVGVDPDNERKRGYGSDEATTQSTNKAVFDRLAQHYGSVEAAVAALAVGPEAVGAAIDSAEAKGNIAAWAQELSPTHKGAVTKALSRWRNDADRVRNVTKEQIRARVIRDNPKMPADQVETAVEKTASWLVQHAEMQSARSLAATDRIFSSLNNGEPINPADLRELNPQQVGWVNRIAARQNVVSPPSDIRVYEEFQDPYALRMMPEVDFRLKGQAYLSPEDFREATIRRQNAMGVKDVDKLYVSREDVANRVDELMRLRTKDWGQGQDGGYVRNKTVDAVRKAVQKQADAKGSPLTPQELDAAVSGVVLGSRAFTPQGFIKSGQYKPIVDMTENDFPSDMLVVGKLMAKAAYGDQFPTGEAAVSVLKDFLLGVTRELPASTIREVKGRYPKELESVQERYKELNGGYLDDTAAIRMMFMVWTKDPKLETLLGKNKNGYNSEGEFVYP